MVDYKPGGKVTPNETRVRFLIVLDKTSRVTIVSKGPFVNIVTFSPLAISMAICHYMYSEEKRWPFFFYYYCTA